ncbi:MAG TPA: hypothetical protein PKD15_01395 [Candidatus Saccharibacteria bacterium]|nr:hypothetical protein [Candidatus Saccharibacteria bacterium]
MKNEPFYELFINHRIESIAYCLRGLDPGNPDTTRQPNYLHATMQASLLEHDFEKEFSVQKMREPYDEHSRLLAARIFGSSLRLVNPIVSIPFSEHPSQPYKGITLQFPDAVELVYRGVSIYRSEHIGEAVPAFYGPHISADIMLSEPIRIEQTETQRVYFITPGNYETFIPMRGLVVAAYERFSKLN